MLFLPKVLKPLDELARPYLHDFDVALKKNNLEELKHSLTHFHDLKNTLFLEITNTIHSIINLLKVHLESHGAGHKVRLKDAKRKIDFYINTLTERAKETILQASLVSPELPKKQIEQLLLDLSSSCSNLQSKLHNELSLYIKSLKLKNKKPTLFSKFVKYIATFLVGMITKFLADNSGVFVAYIKKGVLLLSALMPHRPHILHILHKLHLHF